MAITLITPAKQWMAGAIVQFKFDEYGYGVKDYIYSEMAGWYYAFADTWHTVFLGLGTLLDGDASTRYIRALWTQAQIDSFLVATSKELGYSLDSFAGTALGYYIDQLPQVVALFGVDPYATVISTDPAVLPGVGSYVASGAGAYYYIMKKKTWWYPHIYVFNLGGELVGDYEYMTQHYQLYSSGMVLKSAQADTYIAEHPPTSESIIEYRVGGVGPWLGGNYVSKWVGYVVTTYYKGAAIDGAPSGITSLASREVTVTLQLKQNLPVGGLYIFAPVIGRAFSGGYPTWTPYGWVPGSGGFLSIVGHEKLLVWSDMPKWLPAVLPEGTSGSGGGGSAFASALSVAVIPRATEDEVWMIVRRIINGNLVCYLEQMQPRDYGDLIYAWFVDCGLSYDGAPEDTFLGLEHLEGEEVCILGDGAVFPRQTVVNGQIVLPTTVSKCVIGLPFRYVLKPMRFDILTQHGTSKGSLKKISEVVISFFKTSLAKYGIDENTLYEMDWRTGETYGDPPALFTGDKIVAHEGGFDVEDSIVISGDDPTPCTIRAIVPRIEITGR